MALAVLARAGQVVLPVGMGHPAAETEPSGPDDEGSGFSFCTAMVSDGPSPNAYLQKASGRTPAGPQAQD